MTDENSKVNIRTWLESQTPHMYLASHSLLVQQDVHQCTWQQSEGHLDIKNKHRFAIQDNVVEALCEIKGLS